MLFFSVSRWLFSVMIFLYATGENWKKSLTNGIFSEKYIECGLRTGQDVFQTQWGYGVLLQSLH